MTTVSLQDALNHLRVDDADGEGAYVEMLVAAAESAVAQYLGRPSRPGTSRKRSPRPRLSSPCFSSSRTFTKTAAPRRIDRFLRTRPSTGCCTFIELGLDYETNCMPTLFSRLSVLSHRRIRRHYKPLCLTLSTRRQRSLARTVPSS